MIHLMARNRKLILDSANKLEKKESYVKTTKFKGILKELFRAHRLTCSSDMLYKIVNFADRKGWVQPKYIMTTIKDRHEALKSHPTAL